MTFHVLKENNNNYGTGLVEPANYEEGSGRSRMCVCVCVEGGRGEGRGERERGVGRGLDPPLKFKYLLELSTHEIDTR